MHIGLVGLGKMGGNMRTRLRNAGHTVIGYDRNKDLSDSSSLTDMVEQLRGLGDGPTVVWVMVPAGEPTHATIAELKEILAEGDLVVDGGNSKYTDDADNAASLGVSYRLGYRDTHTSVLEHSGERLQHVRLERAVWRRAGHGRDVGIVGVEAALPLFGPPTGEEPS